MDSKVLEHDTTFLECEALSGRLKDICEGKVLTPEKCDNFRQRRGMTPRFSKPERAVEPIVSQKPLSIFQKAASFVRTVGKSILSGKRSTQEIIDQRLAICQTCPQYSDGGCKLCGCRINQAKVLTNKLANPSARCPAKPPRWDAVE